MLYWTIPDAGAATRSPDLVPARRIYIFLDATGIAKMVLAPSCRPIDLLGLDGHAFAVRLRRAISAIHANLRERPSRAFRSTLKLGDRSPAPPPKGFPLMSIRHCDGPLRGHWTTNYAVPQQIQCYLMNNVH